MVKGHQDMGTVLKRRSISKVENRCSEEREGKKPQPLLVTHLEFRRWQACSVLCGPGVGREVPHLPAPTRAGDPQFCRI